ncbi:hypothetical protein [Myxococcus sp. NMCA1]|uniref:hypothetical protein n=1 Tax=Myxococcus sp. NMCA1 TaxID=2996785 RepID=UPI002286A706|nr:hypothetical protein [Myxococcus sp. NMCA1]WAM28531.1 hypothetical protein OZ403_10620 [Myxococcus sp. NMCA1]
MRRDIPPAQTAEQLRRKRVRDDYARSLRQLRGEPEAPAPAPRVIPPGERCTCGGPLMLMGRRYICELGTHDG